MLATSLFLPVVYLASGLNGKWVAESCPFNGQGDLVFCLEPSHHMVEYLLVC